MKASYCIGIALVIISGSVPKTHASIVNNLECHRFVPPTVIYSSNPCRYPCIVGSWEGPHKVIMQLEPDGTPCKYVGRCSGGTCLFNGNNKLLEPYKWEPISEKNDNPQSNDVIMNGYDTNTPVIGSAVFPIRGFTAETNSNLYATKSQNYIEETHTTGMSYERNRTRKVLQQLFRAKRSPKGHNIYNRRRRYQRGRRTRGSTRRGEQFQYFGIRRVQSGAHDTPPGSTYSYNPPLATTHMIHPQRATTHTYHPHVHSTAVIIFNPPEKKKGRGFSKLATSALGMAAGAAAGAGTAAAIGHLSRPKESRFPITIGKQHEESKIAESQNFDGEKLEYEGKPGKATTVNVKKKEETEKNGSNGTDGTGESERPNIGTTENEGEKRTDSGTTGRGETVGDDEKNRADGFREKELTKAGVNITDDATVNSPTKQKEEHQTGTIERGDSTHSDEKKSGREDGVEKARTNEGSHTENTEGKSETNKKAGTYSTKFPVDNPTDEEKETPKKKRKRKGFFKKLFGKFFQ